MELPAALEEAFEHLGHLRFDQYMELALYAPASGFFATDGRAGRRRGDFITSPEVGPLFGAVVASRLDRLWDDLGRPDPFTVIEGGAGRGALAISVRAAAPACAGALHWVMVERSASLRALQGEHLDISPAAAGGPGPHFLQDTELSEEPVVGAVVANELLDNLPFRLMERSGGRWAEVCVEPDPDSARGLAEVLVEVGPAEVVALDALLGDVADRTRVPWQTNASSWVHRALGAVDRGLVLVFDYCRRTAEMAALPQADWLRTYSGHERGADPLDSPGNRDITVDVALDQLPEPSSVASQADWLAENGIDAMVDGAQQRWQDEAATGGLQAVRARSVLVEAEALRDPTGLGGFCALEWR